jgi:hypothetical protein
MQAIGRRSWLECLWHLFPPLLAVAFPVIFSWELCGIVWRAARPRAVDGTGHYAIAQIYARSIFPDSFGWTHSYFGGMPFPNFYPPLFFWLVGLVSSAHLLPFAEAFKLILCLPPIMLPLSVWILAMRVTDKNRIVAAAAALAITPLLIDYRLFRPTGLDYTSTFVIGLYSQPLGFVFLAGWYAAYCKGERSYWRFTLSALLLALTVLANFFAGVTAGLFVAATVLYDLIRIYGAPGRARKNRQRALEAHLISPILAAGLTLFWIVPMLDEYSYFVTKPYEISLFEFIPPAMWAWYLVAELGVLCWWRRPTPMMWPFLLTCMVLVISVVFASTIAPRWFPFQGHRFLGTFNFLLALPVGQAIYTLYRSLVSVVSRLVQRMHLVKTSKYVPVAVISCMALVFFLACLIVIEPSSYDLAFFRTNDNERIDSLLRFAREHRNGRYLVEIPPAARPMSNSYDSRALISYLGTQGNETVSVVFREASPNAIFFNPLTSAFSAEPDSFGISSVLADDLDFTEQALARHIERARLVGVKYLVVFTPWIKQRLERETTIGTRKDFDVWSVFEIRGEPPPRVRALDFRPALVLSGLSLKLRYNNEYDFVRLAEEQFADGWFDVLLVRSPELKIERISNLDQFGALIIDVYDYDDEEEAFGRLRTFAQSRPLLLLSSDKPLFRRIQKAIADFPCASIIERSVETRGKPLDVDAPTSHYGSNPVRKAWSEIRLILDKNKIACRSPASISAEISQNEIRVRPTTLLSESLPVLIQTTYHPNWQRDDREGIYAATPFFILTFVTQPTTLVYQRRTLDRVAMVASASLFLGLCCIGGWKHSTKSIEVSRGVV